jgi:TPR repeat protein
MVVLAFSVLGSWALHRVSAQQSSSPRNDSPQGIEQYKRGLEAESRGGAALAEAARSYRESAQLGFAPAVTRLGYLYKTGAGVARDPAEAFRLMTAAAESDTEAKFQLALLYVEGVGTPADAATARTWLARAGHAGHQEAQLLLGLLVQQGVGGRRNDVAAAEWMGRAAQGRSADIANRAKAITVELAANIRSQGESRLNLGALLGMALAGLALASASDYDSGAYDSSRQAAKARCESSCMQQAMGRTRTELGLGSAYNLCRSGC